MTPRQADVAFVLESIPGVRAVYAIESARIPLDFAIEIEQSTRTLAAAHFALLRVLTHQDCERVRIFSSAMSPGLIERARPLHLDFAARVGAQQRVPAAPPPAPLPFAPLPAVLVSPEPLGILIVDDDASVIAAVADVFGVETRVTICTRIAEAAELVRTRSFDAILCDAGRAFGTNAFFALVPVEAAKRVIVIVRPDQTADARWRLQGRTDRLLRRPPGPWELRRCVFALQSPTGSTTWTERTAMPPPRGRHVISGSLKQPLRILFVDLNDETVADFCAPLRSAKLESVRITEAAEAVESAFSRAYHLVVCSAAAALQPTGFLSTLEREDAAGAARVLVLVPALDAAYLHEELSETGRSNTVLALPLEAAEVRREVVRVYPPITSQVALGEVAREESARFPVVAYRRSAVLVVDDDTTSKILFSASAAHPTTDVAHVATTMEAFEHCVSRPIDVLVISASMRSDGGEPFYRLLWRLKPELKGRTVLIIPPNAMPPSAPVSKKPRVLERPVTRDAVARVAAAFRED